MKRSKARKEKKKELYELLRTERKSQRKEYTSFLERISEDASMTADLSGELLITLAGRHCLIIRNHGAITQYGNEQIRLKAGRCDLVVEGSSLYLEYSVSEELKIRGNISGVLFKNGTGEA